MQYFFNFWKIIKNCYWITFINISSLNQKFSINQYTRYSFLIYAIRLAYKMNRRYLYIITILWTNRHYTNKLFIIIHKMWLHIINIQKFTTDGNLVSKTLHNLYTYKSLTFSIVNGCPKAHIETINNFVRQYF